MQISPVSLLATHARSYQGICTGDYPRFGRNFWEVPFLRDTWIFQELGEKQCNIRRNGRHIALGTGARRVQGIPEREAWRTPRSVGAGIEGWGSRGIIVNQVKNLCAAIYTGSAFDNNAAIIIPEDEKILPAIYEFCASPQYFAEVRKVDAKLNVTGGTLVKVPFDLARWQKVAAEKYPNGLPEPYSDDPTQWLFHGHPRYAEAGTGLHVALARLAGYRWPAEVDSEMHLSADARIRIAEAANLPEADANGLLALVPVLGERPLADRLRAYCAAAWGGDWTPSMEAALIAAACQRAKDRPPKQLTLDAWLRSHAARQHAKLFHDRPFLWWISDGRGDGFTAVAHYHRLDRANLERLAYTVLGDWITRMGDDPRAEAARILPGQARPHPRRRGALRHFRALEGPRKAADRLGAGSR